MLYKQIKGDEANMKILRRVLALVLSVALFLPSMTVFAKDNVIYEWEADQLYELELLQGYSLTKKVLGLEDELTREAAMKLIVTMIGWDVDMKDRSEFDDVADWAQPYVAVAVDKGITNGMGGYFGGSQVATMHQLVTWYLRALGYDQQDSWDNAATLALSLNLVTVKELTNFDGDINRDKLAGVAYKALKIKPLNSKTSLMEALVRQGRVDERKARALGFLNYYYPDQIEVEDVKAINLVQTLVIYNTLVDEESATDVRNYDIGRNDIVSADLLDDGYSVLLTHEKVHNQEEEELEIDKVKSKDLSSAIDDFEMEVHYLDLDIPTVLSIEAIGNHIFEIIFSEPIEVAKESAFTIRDDDNKRLYVDKVTSSDSSSELNDYSSILHLYTYSNLDEGYYEISIAGDVKDYAGFAVRPFQDDIRVHEDDEGPKVIGYEKVTATEITLIFNESLDVKRASKIDLEDIYHTNAKNHAIDFEVDGNKLSITFKESQHLPEGAGYIIIASDDLMDNWGNLAQTVYYEIWRDMDTEGPTIEDVEVVDEDIIRIEFSEKVEEDSAEEEDYYIIIDDDGDELDIKTIVNDDEFVTIYLKKDIIGEVNIFVDGVEDLSGNECDDHYSFDVYDVTDPKFLDAIIYKINSKEYLLVIRFNERMETEGLHSVLDLDNYNLNGKLLSKFDDVEVDLTDGGKTVEFIIPVDNDNPVYNNGNDRIQIAQMADEEGNTTSGFVISVLDPKTGKMTTSIPVRSGDSGYIDYTAKAISADTIEVRFEDELVDFEESDFPIYLVKKSNTSKKDKLPIASYDIDEDEDGNTVLIFDLNEPLDTTDIDNIDDPSLGNCKLQVIVPNDPESHNEYNEYVVTGAKDVVDEAPPTMLYDKDDNPLVTVIKDVVADGSSRHITIEIPMSEKLYASNGSNALASHDLLVLANGIELIPGIDFDIYVDKRDSITVTIPYRANNDNTEDIFENPDIYDIRIRLDSDSKGYIMDENYNAIQDVDVKVDLDDYNESYSIPEVIENPTAVLDGNGNIIITCKTSEEVSFASGFIANVTVDGNTVNFTEPLVQKTNGCTYQLTTNIGYVNGKEVKVHLNYLKIKDSNNHAGTGTAIITAVDQVGPQILSATLVSIMPDQFTFDLEFDEDVILRDINSTISIEKIPLSQNTGSIENAAVQFWQTNNTTSGTVNYAIEDGYWYKIIIKGDLFKDITGNIGGGQFVLTAEENIPPLILEITEEAITGEGTITFKVMCSEEVVANPNIVSNLQAVINGVIVDTAYDVALSPIDNGYLVNVIPQWSDDVLAALTSVSVDLDYSHILDLFGNAASGTGKVNLVYTYEEPTIEGEPEIVETKVDYVTNNRAVLLYTFTEQVNVTEALIDNVTLNGTHVELGEAIIKDLDGFVVKYIYKFKEPLDLQQGDILLFNTDYSNVKDMEGNTCSSSNEAIPYDHITYQWEFVEDMIQVTLTYNDNVLNIMEDGYISVKKKDLVLSSITDITDSCTFNISPSDNRVTCLIDPDGLDSETRYIITFNNTKVSFVNGRQGTANTTVRATVTD